MAIICFTMAAMPSVACGPAARAMYAPEPAPWSKKARAEAVAAAGHASAAIRSKAQLLHQSLLPRKPAYMLIGSIM